MISQGTKNGLMKWALLIESITSATGIKRLGQKWIVLRLEPKSKNPATPGPPNKEATFYLSRTHFQLKALTEDYQRIR